MCRWLNIPRSSYYYQAVNPVSEDDLEDKITIFSLRASPDMGLEKSRNA